MVAGLKYTRAKGDVMGTPYREMARDLQGIIEQELTKAGKDGKREAQITLEAANTGRAWQAGPWGETGSGNRIQTGTMYDALDYRIVRGKQVGLDVGWPRVWADYFGYQDKGFSATGFRRSSPTLGDNVAGMGIIAHLQTYMRGTVDEALDRATERIVNGL